MTHQWRFPAQCLRVIDGDTLELYVDLGMRKYEVTRVRLLGVNCPEIRGPERPEGLTAKEFVERWMCGLMAEWPLIIETQKDDVFGRWLARVYAGDLCLNDRLIETGMGAPAK